MNLYHFRFQVSGAVLSDAPILQSLTWFVEVVKRNIDVVHNLFWDVERQTIRI